MPITKPCDSITVSEVKFGARGLNRQLSAHAAGGWGGRLSPTTGSCDQEIDGQHDTYKGSSHSNPAHC